ncbi:phage major capsid protein, P2 family [Edwardsiella tarda]|uniref:phage major capsid protein, P2 family n=1 Tax=Edwardsiella tarda TaxID=636 RepID=UPI0024452124|nr:phage major capsid protein, P2 family [Edwardsiella tarda]WGE29426.1 phage major capsid protein, P2 family [Edwardsiella tarda]
MNQFLPVGQSPQYYSQLYLNMLHQTFADCPRSSDNVFALTPPRSTALRNAILQSTDFLQQITMMDVPYTTGQVITVGESTLRTGRKKTGRFTKGSGTSGNEFKLVETDSCCVITWEQLATWGNSGSLNQFVTMMNNAAVTNFALDMLRIGFNGTSVGEDSDPSAHPNGEDVNIGWHQYVKNYYTAIGSKAINRIITEAVHIGTGGDYVSLDAAGSDLVRSLPATYQNHPDLIILVGADLVAAEEVRLYNQEDKPTENVAAQKLSKNIAGRPAIVPPFMPGKRMVATTLKNLQLMTLANSRRRKAEDVGDRKQFENSYWRYEGYAVGDPDCYAALDESAVTLVARGKPVVHVDEHGHAG